MKRYIRSNKDIDNILHSFNLDDEIKGLANTFKEFGDDDEDSKADFIAQHIYDMLHDITFDDVFEYVKDKI